MTIYEPISPDTMGSSSNSSSSKINSPYLNAVPYPSPFFDLSDTWMPTSLKSLFQFCTYYYTTHPIVPAVVNKLASYAVSTLIFSTPDDKLKKKWENVLITNMNLPFELVQAAINIGVYGNNFSSLYFPFNRYLVCPKCKNEIAFKKVTDKKMTGRKLTISGVCPICKTKNKYTILDKPLKDTKKIKLVTYNVNSIVISKDPVSGHCKYMWRPDKAYATAIKQGKDWDLIERAPEIVIKAIAEKKLVVLSEDTFFHMKRTSLSAFNSSWGTPVILPALKNLYYLQLLKMAQTAIAVQHVVPLWVLFPQTGNGSTLPPAALIGLSKWKDTIEEEITKWKKDPNHIPVLNFPIGFEQIGGEGRSLLLAPEIKQETENSIISMGVPLEFVYGGLSWTGSSITLRMLENTFTGIRDGLQRYIEFIVNGIHKFMGYGPIDIYMAELKMSDDVQRQQLSMNMNGAGKLSDTTFMSEMGYDIREEMQKMEEEYPMKILNSIRQAMMQAKAEGEASLEQLDYQVKGQIKQMKLQQSMQAPVAPEQGSQGGQGGQGGQIQEGSIDPQSGLTLNSQGIPLNPDTGQPMTEEEYNQYMSQVQQAAGQGQGQPQGQSQDQSQGDPLESIGITPEEAQTDEAEATQGTMSGMPPALKAQVTHVVNQLVVAPVAIQQQVLAEMAQQMPRFHELVVQAMTSMGMAQSNEQANLPANMMSGTKQ